MRILGLLFFVAGAAWIYNAYGLDISVSQYINGEFEQVVNLAKVEARNAQILMASVVTLAGAIFLGAGGIIAGGLFESDRSDTCLACAESVRKDAKVCPHCGNVFLSENVAQAAVKPATPAKS